MVPTLRFATKPLGSRYGFAVYVAKLIPWLRAKRDETHAKIRASDNEGNAVVPLQKDQVLLVVLSFARGEALTPVQVQKALFLADDKVTTAFQTRYDFQPYDYGPFDRHVYADAQALSRQGLVTISRDPNGGWDTYAATDAGIRRGRELRDRLDENQRTVLSRIVGLVRRLSFSELVSAIYKAYPHMRERSVFRD